MANQRVFPKQRRVMVPSPTRNAMNEIIELDRPMGRKAVKSKLAAQIIKLRKMKYALLKESLAQRKEFYRLKAEKMEYDMASEDEMLRLKGERLKIEAKKLDLAKKESDVRIMMIDVSVMPKLQRLYFDKLQREIMMRDGHA